MARVKVDWRGVEEVATSAWMHGLVNDAAEATAENVKAQGITVGDKDGGSHEYALPVLVRKNETSTRGRGINRAMAAVQLNHASGLAVQAKSGALSNAASAAGLKLKGD